MGGGQARHRGDGSLEVLVESLAQVVRQVCHEAEEGLLAELLSLLDEFYQQIEDAIAVVQNLREAVAKRSNLAGKGREGLGQIEFSPFEKGIPEV